jgi:hypothetical protein
MGLKHLDKTLAQMAINGEILLEDTEYLKFVEAEIEFQKCLKESQSQRQSSK